MMGWKFKEVMHLKLNAYDSHLYLGDNIMFFSFLVKGTLLVQLPCTPSTNYFFISWLCNCTNTGNFTRCQIFFYQRTSID